MYDTFMLIFIIFYFCTAYDFITSLVFIYAVLFILFILFFHIIDWFNWFNWYYSIDFIYFIILLILLILLIVLICFIDDIPGRTWRRGRWTGGLREPWTTKRRSWWGSTSSTLPFWTPPASECLKVVYVLEENETLKGGLRC